MDPFTAIGTVSAILTFIDVGVKVINGAIEIHDSASHSTAETCSAATVAREMNGFVQKLKVHDQTAFTAQEKSLCALAKECCDIAAEISALTLKTTAAQPKSWASSLKASFKAKKHEEERRRLLQRLSDSRSQLDLQLNYWTRSVCHGIHRSCMRRFLTGYQFRNS
jgi:hypothetical protein